MDRVGEWRLIEPVVEGSPDAPGPRPEQADGRSRLIGVAAVAGVVLAVAGLAIWSTTPQSQSQLLVETQAGRGPIDLAGGAGESQSIASIVPAAPILVDVQGAVVRPGLHRLADGSRVGDAIAAAGGYSAHADIRAAADRLNLAEKLADGGKVYVPALGDTIAGAPNGASVSVPAGTGLIDVNHATAEQLDTLPGIGPVTASKIIAAREEAPFATVDDLLARGVVGQSTFDKILKLITVLD